MATVGTATENKFVAKEIGLWLCAAAVVRLFFLFATPMVIDSADSILYLDATTKIAAFKFAELYPRIPLLYPALSALFVPVAHNGEIAAISVSFAFGMSLVIPIYILMMRMHGRRTARIAALIAVLWPWLIDYSCRVAPEALYVFCWFASVVLVIRTVRDGGIAQFVLPITLTALYLARPEGIVLAAAFLLFAPLCCARRTDLLRLLPAVAILLVCIPLNHLFIQHLSLHSGITPRFSGGTFSFSLIARGKESARAAYQLLTISLPVMVGPLLGALLIPGLIARQAQPRDRRLELYVAALAFTQFCAAALSTFAEPRYVMATVIAISAWSARGAVVMGDWFKSKFARRWLEWLPAMAVALLFCAGLLPSVLPPMLGRMSYKPLEYKIAGEWMRHNLQPGLILCRKPQVGYYAGMESTGSAPSDSLEDTRRRVADANIRYVVVDERYSTKMIPALAPLLDPTNAPAWLKPLRADLSPYREGRIAIYEVVPERLRP